MLVDDIALEPEHEHEMWCMGMGGRSINYRCMAKIIEEEIEEHRH